MKLYNSPVQGMLTVVHIYKYEQSYTGMCIFFSRSVIENDQISLFAKLGVFTIVGTTGNVHAVHLFPQTIMYLFIHCIMLSHNCSEFKHRIERNNKSTRVNLSQL